MNLTEPKYRRPLNQGQLRTLKLLYKFRFASTRLISQYESSHEKTVYFRLRILCDQGYIGRYHTKEHFINRQHASYYLLPNGIRALKTLTNFDTSAIHSHYKDRYASEQFRSHCLKVFNACCSLKTIYGDKLRCFTKADLKSTSYNYFPNPLPDTFLRLEDAGSIKQFFLDVYETSVPFYQNRRRLSDYIEYELSKEWERTKTAFPSFLCVAETEQLQRRLTRQARKALDDSTKMRSAFNTIALNDLSRGSAYWLNTESNDIEEL